MRRWLALGFAIVVAQGCGEKSPGPGVGANNNNEVDMAGPNNVPDPNNDPNNTTNVQPNNDPADLGAPDAASDMNVVDVGPDLPDEVDMGGPVDMGPNCPRVNVPYGGACGCNQECTSGVCVDASVNEDGFCSRSCTARTDCPTGASCVTDRFGTSVCRTDDTGTDCAAAGQSTPGLCSAGYCVQAGSNYTLDYFCSVPCDSAADCKLAHSCTPMRCQFTLDGSRCIPTVIAHRSPNKAQVLTTYPQSASLCVPLGEPNPCGAITMASDEQACAGAMCDASPTGRCTAQCTTTPDCPSGGCVDYDVSDGTLPIRVCDL